MSNLWRALVFTGLAGVGCLAYAADVSGTWTASFDTQVGKQSYTYELKVQGTALTGTELMGFPAEEFVAKRSK